MTREEAAIAVRARVVLEALAWLGTPYRHQASVKGAGTDCLGLVRGVFRATCGRETEVPPPYPARLSPAQGEVLLAAATRHLIRRERAEPGDVLLFRMRRTHPVSHCGILVSPRRFVHAYEGQGVLSTAWDEGWQRRTAAIFAFPEAS